MSVVTDVDLEAMPTSIFLNDDDDDDDDDDDKTFRLPATYITFILDIVTHILLIYMTDDL